jgi:hypothetical protein
VYSAEFIAFNHCSVSFRRPSFDIARSVATDFLGCRYRSATHCCSGFANSDTNVFSANENRVGWKNLIRVKSVYIKNMFTELTASLWSIKLPNESVKMPLTVVGKLFYKPIGLELVCIFSCNQ